MKVRWMAVLGVGFMAVQAIAGEPEGLTTRKEKMSYAVGVDMGRNLRQLETEVDVELLMKGLKDGLADKKLLMTEKELWEIRNATQLEMRRQRAEQRQKKALTSKTAANDNRKAGEAFLAENRSKEGVVTLPSGLQYKVVVEGSGRSPTATDNVTIRYRGTLVDGSEFDSTDRQGKPATFRVDGAIPGWREALPLMKEGAKWIIVLPSRLAYDGRGAMEGKTVIFELELISVGSTR